MNETPFTPAAITALTNLRDDRARNYQELFTNPTDPAAIAQRGADLLREGERLLAQMEQRRRQRSR
jgi:hypothetical protein